MAVSIEPKAGAPGTVLTVKGNSLDKSRIDEVYLTDHRFDMMVKVLEQGGESMKIRIPPFAKPGRLQLLFLTAGAKPLYLEQPLYVEIRDPEDVPAPAAAPSPVEISKAAPAPPAPAPAPVAAPAQPMPKPQAVEIAQAQPAKGQAIVADFSPEPIPAVQPSVAQPARQVAPAIVPAPQAPPVAQVVESRRTPARLVKRGNLKYPELARSMKREGSVDLMLTIAADGTVREVKALTGDHTLRSAAEESARTWKYEPARNGAEAVESVQNVSIAFKLR